MMKGSSSGQAASPQGGGRQFSLLDMYPTILHYMAPGAFPKPQSGTGTKGSVQPQQPAPMSMPSMPQYVNYQQMPTYNSGSSAPSQSILNFMNAGNYASGGSAKSNASDEEIEAAMRLVRLLGELSKK